MIAAGDYDGLQLSHALELFEARGGTNEEVALKGFMTTAPRARLAILPGTSHIGMNNEGKLLARLVATPARALRQELRRRGVAAFGLLDAA
jgi:hypothetical protein